MIPEITAVQAVTVAERLLADPAYGPRYLAPNTYGTRDQPGDIAGHILAAHDPDAFDRIRPRSKLSRHQFRFDFLIGLGRLRAPLPVARAIGHAQDNEMNGDEWGIALQPILELKHDES